MLILRGMWREEPVAKHHIPIPSAHESNKHRMWQRRTVKPTYNLYSGGQHCIDQPGICKGKKRCVGGESREMREKRETGGCMLIPRRSNAIVEDRKRVS